MKIGAKIIKKLNTNKLNYKIMAKKLERTTKPFPHKKGYVSIYEENKPNTPTSWSVKVCNNYGTIKIEPVENFTHALQKFYFHLCWLLDSKTMAATSKQRIHKIK